MVRDSRANTARSRRSSASRRQPPYDRFDACEELEHSNGLDHVFVRTDAEALHLVHLLIARGKNEHTGGPSCGAITSQHLESVQTRQHQIENDEIGIVLLEPGECIVSVRNALDLVALDLEAGSKAERQRLVVLDDQDRAIGDDVSAAGRLPRVRHGALPLWLAGRTSVNRVPPVGVSDSAASASIAVARSRTIASPSPAPPVLSSTVPPSRKNGFQTLSRSEAGIPGPVSSTQSRTMSPSVRTPRELVCPITRYLAALSRTLRSI